MVCKVKTVTFYNNIDTEQILGSCSNISVVFFQSFKSGAQDEDEDIEA